MSVAHPASKITTHSPRATSIEHQASNSIIYAGGCKKSAQKPFIFVNFCQIFAHFYQFLRIFAHFYLLFFNHLRV